ncbi:hypothetical protein Pmani_001908 [Petrolisthes manimaculis]|uniref:Uncharacterized protein n=1 Tax=Petrolisthes manimaculis TaxID=1843537 RepID=A0AAE1UR26_9EUCA|nr:hypothetical protein Pmani_001908 [Petrolisthes manimaculis]
MANGTGLLLCAMYRSPRQGHDPINFLTEHLDDLLTRHRCRHVLIMEGAAYENLLMVQGLTDQPMNVVEHWIPPSQTWARTPSPVTNLDRLVALTIMPS